LQTEGLGTIETELSQKNENDVIAVACVILFSIDIVAGKRRNRTQPWKW